MSCNTIPFAVQPHYTRQHDPHFGEEFKIIVVLVEMELSWDDGYNAMGGQIVVTAFGEDVVPIGALILVKQHYASI